MTFITLSGKLLIRYSERNRRETRVTKQKFWAHVAITRSMVTRRLLATLTRQPLILQPTPLNCHAVRHRFSAATMAAVQAVIDGKIQSKKVMVFSKSFCPFCTKAKKVFDKLIKDGSLSSDDYEVMEIENDKDCEAMQAYFQKKTGGRSVPRVFIKQKFFGGGDDVVAANNKGTLVGALQ